MRLPLALVVAATASVALEGVAGADEAAASPAPARRAQLVYSRGDIASCPEEDSLKNAVTIRLGYDPFLPDPEHVVTATITRHGGGLRGQVDLSDRARVTRGSRTLTTDKSDCAELASSMALAITIAIDPLSVTRPKPEAVALPSLAPGPSPPTGPAPPPPLPPKDVPAATPPARAEDRALGVRVGATAAAGFGVTPGASFAPSVLAGISTGALSVDVEGRAHFATSVDASPHGSVSASMLLVMFAPCFHVRVATACALVGAGSLSGSGNGVDVPENDATLYANAGARLGIELPLGGPLWLRAVGDVLFPLVATQLRLRGAEVWSTPPITAAIGAGLLAKFP